MNKYLLAIAIAFASMPAAAATESDYRNRFCAGMPQERVLPNGTRVDCINDRFAIEVDWSHKWAEAIGQAMSYSATTRKRPAIILICKVAEAGCLKHEYLLNEAAAYWKVPLRVWLCMPSDGSLSDCRQRDY